METFVVTKAPWKTRDRYHHHSGDPVYDDGDYAAEDRPSTPRVSLARRKQQLYAQTCAVMTRMPGSWRPPRAWPCCCAPHPPSPPTTFARHLLPMCVCR